MNRSRMNHSQENLLREIIHAHLDESARVKQAAVDACTPALLRAVEEIAAAFSRSNKLLLCGNGGSAADCQHLASEFVNRLSKARERDALPALALTTDTSFLTSYANDYAYEGIFERQVQALGKPGDVLIGISTSGGSANVRRALSAARIQGMRCVVLCGAGGNLGEMADVSIAVPSTNTQYVQETHLALEHLICELVEMRLYDSANNDAES